MSCYRLRELFGGAIVAMAPLDLIDASSLREVPNTQEVLLYPDSSVSLIIEILVRVEADEPYEAVKFHFDSIAHDNQAAITTMEEQMVLIHNDRPDDSTPSPIIIHGTQDVRKYTNAVADHVHISIGLFRVAVKGIDLVVTLNAPLQSVDNGAVDGAGLSRAREDFDTLVRSLRILDFGLFA